MTVRPASRLRWGAGVIGRKTQSTRVSVVEVETPGPKAGRTFGLAQTETAWVLLDLKK